MKLTVSQKKTTPISKDLIGVFFEDINYGADGGIYAELIGDMAGMHTRQRTALACRSFVEVLFLMKILIIFALQQMRQVLAFPIRHIAELP